jgi:hypothetical protein
VELGGEDPGVSTGAAINVGEDELPIPCDLPEEYRYARHADGSPALRVCLVLSREQAQSLDQWFTERTAALKAAKWSGWNPGDMALRTLCVQIADFGKRAFGRNTELSDSRPL